MQQHPSPSLSPSPPIPSCVPHQALPACLPSRVTLPAAWNCAWLTPGPLPYTAGATGTLMGLCLSCNCLAEVPVFFFSGRILEVGAGV